MNLERIAVPVARPAADANIRPLYEIEKACWLWHPDRRGDEEAVLLFRNRFTAREPSEIVLHVSADQRYELCLDGDLISLGPDRSDPAHWSFASYRLRIEPGEHVLEALVWWIGDHAPAAQMSVRGGFILASESDWAATLNTGTGRWEVRAVNGWSFEPAPEPHFVGASHILEGTDLFRESEFTVPCVVHGPVREAVYGGMRTGWRLFPSPLPDPVRRAVHAGRAVAVLPGGWTGATPLADGHLASPELPAWQALADGRAALTVPAATTVSALLDLEDYFCAYPVLTLSGGRCSEVTVAWAESLFEPDAAGGCGPAKGNRDEVSGKFFVGIRDVVRTDGGTRRAYRPCWWRAGRYLLVTVRTQEEPLTIDSLHLLESRYPLENEGCFSSSSPDLNGLVPMLVRGLQMCAHETYMDCPYYEQLNYVGDTRVQMLAATVLTRDDRLARRCIELFDWSRSTWQVPAEHYPGRQPQLSPTYALLWPGMVRDFAEWRDDTAFIRSLLPGIRGMLEPFRAWLGESGLLQRLPGWPFVDWVPEWDTGNAPDGVAGVSAVNSLLLVQALQDAARLEDDFGEAVLAQRNRVWARDLSARIVNTFWEPERNLLADDTGRRFFSEHAQCLALLNGVLDDRRSQACFRALISAGDLARTSVYFSFYLFETFYRFGRGDLIVSKMSFWQDLLRKGCRTPIESADPCRSDCHAWGSHPLYHFHASLAGIRPAAPGFRAVRIAPSPGPLTQIHSRIPHPRGWVEAELRFDATTRACSGTVCLPEGTAGVFVWQDRRLDLPAGRTTNIRMGGRTP